MQEIQITIENSLLRDGFTQFPNYIWGLNISPGAKLVYICLLSYSYIPKFKPSLETLAKNCNCDSITIHNLLKELQGYKRIKSGNKYKWSDEPELTKYIEVKRVGLGKPNEIVIKDIKINTKKMLKSRFKNFLSQEFKNFKILTNNELINKELINNNSELSENNDNSVSQNSKEIPDPLRKEIKELFSSASLSSVYKVSPTYKAKENTHIKYLTNYLKKNYPGNEKETFKKLLDIWFNSEKFKWANSGRVNVSLLYSKIDEVVAEMNSKETVIVNNLDDDINRQILDRYKKQREG